MDLDPLPPKTVPCIGPASQSPPEVTLLLDDLFQTSKVLERDLDMLARLVRHPDHRFADSACWKTLVSQLCVLDALLIDATWHAKRCSALYQSC